MCLYLGVNTNLSVLYEDRVGTDVRDGSTNLRNDFGDLGHTILNIACDLVRNLDIVLSFFLSFSRLLALSGGLSIRIQTNAVEIIVAVGGALTSSLRLQLEYSFGLGQLSWHLACASR